MPAFVLLVGLSMVWLYALVCYIIVSGLMADSWDQFKKDYRKTHPWMAAFIVLETTTIIIGMSVK